MTLTNRRDKDKTDGKDARNHGERMKESSERMREREEGKSDALLWRWDSEDMLFVEYGE